MKEHVVFIVEPFFGGSHALWIHQLIKHLSCKTVVFSLPASHWKWRMTASALTLAKRVNESELHPEVILTTDMLDVALFKSLLRPELQSVRLVCYMHENQLVYPMQNKSNPNWDRHYAFKNFTSCFVADRVCFNSEYHKSAFLKSLRPFLQAFPDHQPLQEIIEIEQKSTVLYPGIDVDELKGYKQPKSHRPTVLWSHRWEHDKNPQEFFDALLALSAEGLDFDVIVCGEHYKKSPDCFAKAKERLSKHLVHWGYFNNREAYLHALWKATVLPVSSFQENFGISVLEAAFCGCELILPNRLVYSELYSNSAQFYSNQDEFIHLLRDHITKNKQETTSPNFERFSWISLIEAYQEVLFS
ncbi:MAG: glycosyltransferase involved in cell wall biosynthesis [Bacteroidia bacterium]|jgi:glycosyltransferase involved in cell wall biosynthesis